MYHTDHGKPDRRMLWFCRGFEAKPARWRGRPAGGIACGYAQPTSAAGLLLAAWSALASGPAWAADTAGPGRIEGRVIDASTRAPLAGASVAVVDTRRGAFTKPDGTYRIDNLPPGTYRLQFSSIGYQVEIRTDIVASAASPTRVDEELIPAAVQLEAITVRPQLFAKEMAAPSSTTTLRREEIRRFPGGFEDVVTTVTALPGVAQVTGGGRNDLVVRGGGPAENLYIVNGLEVPNINHFATPGASGGALSYVNLDFVDRVEFSTGGFGARHGDRMSSVLDLGFRPGRQDRIGGRVTLSASQYGLEIEGPATAKGSFVASARRSYLDLIFKAAGQPFVPVYTDLNLFVELAPTPRNRVSVLGLAAFDEVDTDRGDAKKRRTVASLLDNSQRQLSGSVRLRHLVEDGYAELVAGIDQIRFDLSQADTSAIAEEYYRTRAIEGATTLKTEVSRRLRPGLRASGGASLKWVGTDNTTAFADTIYDSSGRRVPRAPLGLPAGLRLDRTDEKLAVWTEAETDLSSLWRLSFGLRVDRFAPLADPWTIAPRLSASHRPSDRVKLLASLGRYYQSPSVLWLVNPDNRDLAPLRCDMGVLGGEVLLRDDTSLRLETYYKRYRDLPGGVEPGSATARATDYLVLTNTGVGFGGREDDFGSFGYLDLASRASGEAFGTELFLRKKLSEVPCYGQASIGVGKSGVRALNGRWYPGSYDQRFILGLSGGYVFNSRWEMSARFRLITGAPYTPVYDPRTTPAGETQLLPEEYLARRLGPAHQLDLRVDRRWNFARRALVGFVDVQNVYNYRAPQKPRWDFGELDVTDRAAIGILPTIGVRAEF